MRSRKISENKSSRQSGMKNDKNGDVQGTTSSLLLLSLKIVMVSMVLVHVVAPITLITNPWIQSKLVFLNMFMWPPFIDVTRPEDLGLKDVKNFYLNVNKDSTIGVWHIPPSSHISGHDIDYEGLMLSGKPIIMYLHGTSGSRGGWHRVQLYKLLVSMGYQVFAFDYRGYADSHGTPTEDGVVEDSYFVYKWIKKHCGKTPVFLWGHSLGTAITTKLAKMLTSNKEEPYGIVLESPFTNIREAAAHHPFTWPYRSLPWFESVFLDSISENGIYFQSDVSINFVKVSLLILHAEDDKIVPYSLGKKLFEIARKNRPSNGNPLDFKTFNATYGYGHKLIFKAPELPPMIDQFISSCLSQHES